MSEPKIYPAIVAVMNDIGAIGKTSRNQQQGFMYRGIDAVMNALHPLMAEHKIFCVPEVLEQTREERTNARGTTLLYSICKIKYTFYAEDGSSVSAVVIGEGMDTGDKATNKAMAIAFKYACFQVFCIPTEEMVDPDAESHEVAPEPITAGVVTMIRREIAELELDEGKVLQTYGAKVIEDLTAEQGKNCLKRLDKTRENMQRLGGGKE